MHFDPIERAPLDPAFVAALKQRFGDALQMSDAMRLHHGSSEAHFAPMLPDAVVFARSTEGVVDLVKLCTAAKVPIVAFGAGTSIEGNTLAVHGGVSVDLSEMTQIVSINAEDFDCTVQAGVRRSS